MKPTRWVFFYQITFKFLFDRFYRPINQNIFRIYAQTPPWEPSTPSRLTKVYLLNANYIVMDMVTKPVGFRYKNNIGLAVATTLQTSIFGTSDITFDKIIDGTKTLDELALVNSGEEEFDSTLLRLGKGIR